MSMAACPQARSGGSGILTRRWLSRSKAGSRPVEVPPRCKEAHPSDAPRPHTGLSSYDQHRYQISPYVQTDSVGKSLSINCVLRRLNDLGYVLTEQQPDFPCYSPVSLSVREHRLRSQIKRHGDGQPLPMPREYPSLPPCSQKLCPPTQQPAAPAGHASPDSQA